MRVLLARLWGGSGSAKALILSVYKGTGAVLIGD